MMPRRRSGIGKPPTKASPAPKYNLGAMYADGHGVPLDYVEAYKWLSVAVSRFPVENRDAAVRMRDLLAAKMTPTQIAEAQKRAREWKPK